MSSRLSNRPSNGRQLRPGVHPMPLAGFRAHLRLIQAQMAELEPSGTRWGAPLAEPTRPPAGEPSAWGARGARS